MKSNRMITIDEALTQIDSLRNTLQALRLLPETMPVSPINLAMTKALRGLKFNEISDLDISPLYAVPGLAKFDRVDVGWSETFLYCHNAVAVRARGQKRLELDGREHWETVAIKIIEIPMRRLSGDLDAFPYVLYELVADATTFSPWTRDMSSQVIDWKPIRWPEDEAAFLAQRRPKVAVTGMTDAERAASEALDKGKFW